MGSGKVQRTFERSAGYSRKGIFKIPVMYTGKKCEKRSGFFSGDAFQGMLLKKKSVEVEKESTTTTRLV